MRFKLQILRDTNHKTPSVSPSAWSSERQTGGTQIAKQSLDHINRYLIEWIANQGGAFSTSIASDAVLDEAHEAMADFYNASSAQEIVFGNHMATLTLCISRSISREWKERDEIVVTRLDHDANVAPWVLAA